MPRARILSFSSGAAELQRRLSRGSRTRGLTLVELLVAITIFSLVLASLFVAFRTGVKAASDGTKFSEGAQSTRFVVRQIATDLRNVFYRTPASYNITRRQHEAVIQEREKNALRAGRSREELAEDDTMPELGPKIDLAFRATDGGELDALTFVRLQGEKVGRDRQPWGLARVHYYVAEGALWRAMEDATGPEQDEYGNDIPKAVAPRVDKLVDGVTGFDMKFGYYGVNAEMIDAEWATTGDWDSDTPTYRNPQDEEDLEMEDSAAPGRSTVGTDATAPAGTTPQNGQSQQQTQPDDLPAWVDITFRFSTDPEKPENEKVYRQIIQLPQSQETYVPEDPATDDDNRRTANSSRSGGSSRSGSSSRSERSTGGSRR